MNDLVTQPTSNENLVTQPTLLSIVKQTDTRIAELVEKINTTALSLSGITKIESVEHSNGLVEVIRKAKEPIREIDEAELEVRRQVTAWGKQRQEKAQSLYKPLIDQVERITDLRTNFVLEQERIAKEAKERQEQERKAREAKERQEQANKAQAIQALGTINAYFIGLATASRDAYVKQLSSFESIEAIESFYAGYSQKPNVKISAKHIQLQLENYSTDVQELILAQLDFDVLSNSVNLLAKDNYEYIVGLKEAYINAINDAEERIRIAEQAKKDAAALAEKQKAEADRLAEQAKIEADRQAADAALQSELNNQVEIQTLAQPNKGVRKKMALNQVVSDANMPITTFSTLLNVFLHNGGDRGKLLKMLIPVFNKTNKDNSDVVLQGFMWKEDITVAN